MSDGNGYWKVRRGIPVPPSKWSKYEFIDKMKPGDYFDLPSEAVPKLYQALWHRKPMTFTIRKLDNQSHRCWRTDGTEETSG